MHCAHNLVWTKLKACYQLAGFHKKKFKNPLSTKIWTFVPIQKTTLEDIAVRKKSKCVFFIMVKLSNLGIKVLPVQAWVLVAPTHTLPTHIRSHHLRWSSSGSPRISSPSSPQCEFPSRGLGVKDAPLSHRAPGSSHTGAASKQRRIRSHKEQTQPFIHICFLALLCLLHILSLITHKVLAFTFLAPVGWDTADLGFFFALTVKSSKFLKSLKSAN